MTGMQVIENGIIVDSSSIVPIISVTDMLASRAFDTVYTNTTGKTMYVHLSFLCYVPGITNEKSLVYARLGGVLDFWLGGIGWSTVTIPQMHLVFSSTFPVKPNQTYEVKTLLTFGGTVTLKSWVESY